MRPHWRVELAVNQCLDRFVGSIPTASTIMSNIPYECRYYIIGDAREPTGVNPGG